MKSVGFDESHTNRECKWGGKGYMGQSTSVGVLEDLLPGLAIGIPVMEGDNSRFPIPCLIIKEDTGRWAF
jgi:hypothetical protein